MGLGLLLLACGAFLRFILGRYAGHLGEWDAQGTVLMVLGVIAMIVGSGHRILGTPRLVRRQTAARADARAPRPGP